LGNLTPTTAGQFNGKFGKFDANGWVNLKRKFEFSEVCKDPFILWLIVIILGEILRKNHARVPIPKGFEK
jgi:hypothetical protein